MSKDFKLFGGVTAGAVECYDSPDYFYDNAVRKDVNRLLVQQTLAGEVEFREGKRTRRVGVGQAMLFTYREESCYGYPEDGTEVYKTRFLALTPAVGIRALFEAIRAAFGSVVVMQPGAEAARMLEVVHRRHKGVQFRDRLEENEVIYRLLLAIYREQVLSTRDTDPIEYGDHLMRDRYCSPIRLEEIATECGVTREHFIREYGKRYGRSPGEQLRHLRLNRAREVLGATKIPVEDVAVLCGFSSSNTFSRAFRRRFECSPTRWRVRASGQGAG